MSNKRQSAAPLYIYTHAHAHTHTHILLYNYCCYWTVLNTCLPQKYAWTRREKNIDHGFRASSLSLCVAAQKADQAVCRNITLNVNSFGFAVFAIARVWSTRRHDRAHSFVNITQIHARANMAVKIRFLNRSFWRNMFCCLSSLRDGFNSAFSRSNHDQISTVKVGLI